MRQIRGNIPISWLPTRSRTIIVKKASHTPHAKVTGETVCVCSSWKPFTTAQGKFCGPPAVSRLSPRFGNSKWVCVRIRSLIYWITEADIFCIHPPPRGLPNRVSNLIIACKLGKRRRKHGEKSKDFFTTDVCVNFWESGARRETEKKEIHTHYVHDTCVHSETQVLLFQMTSFSQERKKGKDMSAFFSFPVLGKGPWDESQDEDGFFRCQMKRSQK